MDSFRSKGKCTAAVIVEMILAGVGLFSLAILILIKMAKQEAEQEDDVFWMAYKEPSSTNLPDLDWQTLFFSGIKGIQIMTSFLLLYSGGKVLFDACSLTPAVQDWERLESAGRTCKAFCRLELFRMAMVLVVILINLFIQVHSVKEYEGDILTPSTAGAGEGLLTVMHFILKLPILFAWFFTGEFRKELIFHRETVSGGYFYGHGHSNSEQALGFSSINPGVGVTDSDNYEEEIRRQNRQFGEVMMYTTPSITYCMSNLTR